MKGLNRKKWKYLLPVCVILALFLCVIIYRIEKSPYAFREKESFSEIPETGFSLSAAQADNINAFLKSMQYEDDSYFGFTASTADNISLQDAKIVTDTASLLQDESQLALLESKFRFLENISVENLGILDLIYYVDICRTLNIPYNKSEVDAAILKFYDEDAKLFFLTNENDDNGTKLVVTANCCIALEQDLPVSVSELQDGVRTVYSGYSFTTNGTFYNAGGDILYCAEALGMTEELNLTELQSWFGYWKDFYESLSLDSIDAAMKYSEFYDVARIMDGSYSGEKIQEYYESLESIDVSDTYGLFMLNIIMRNAKQLSNSGVNEFILSCNADIINSGELFTNRIDLASTVFGILLAKQTGYAIDKEKVNHYIEENYGDIADSESTQEKARILYYNLILEELMEGAEYEEDFYQEAVDEILESIDSSENFQNDITSVRRVVEVVMELQKNGADVNISKNQRNRIGKALKESMEDQDILHSVRMTDIYLVDRALQLGLVDTDLFESVYSDLVLDGGSRMWNREDCPADIYSTYRFYVCFGRMGNSEHIEEQKKYADSLEIREGIYEFYRDDGYYDMMSILYGNCIAGMENRGDGV